MGIKRLVDQLIRKYGTNNPFRIAAEKDIQIFREPLGGIAGYFHTYKRIRMIHLNDSLDEIDQQFTCSHELGHALLHPKLNTPFLKRHTFVSIDKIEREANEFAVELLIPDDILQDDMCLYSAASMCGVPKDIAFLKRLPARNYTSHI